MTADQASRPLRIFGIRNCDTMKKAFNWLRTHGIAHEFVDYRRDGISVGQLAAWSQRSDWQRLLNTRGTTWKKLGDEQRRGMNHEKALALMAAQPALIRRPVIEAGDSLLIGFDEQTYARELLTTE